MSAHLEPEDEPGEAADDEEDVPEPEDEVDLVNDDVEAEDTERIQSGLPAPGAEQVVSAAGHAREGLAHGVPAVLQHDLLRRQAVESVDVRAVGQEIAACQCKYLSSVPSLSQLDLLNESGGIS